MTNCDMCGSKIQDGRCDCGVWKSKEEMEGNPMLKAIESFHDMKKFTLTGDAPYLGCAVVFFRGDYNDCQKVQKFIYEMKGRPYYEEKESCIMCGGPTEYCQICGRKNERR